MQSILEAFAQHRLYTLTCDYMNTSEYETVSLRSYDLKKKLTANLNQEGKNLLEDLLGTHKEITTMSEIDQFVRGYRLGFLMSAEAYGGAENLIYRPEASEIEAGV